jgi:hypothetical protein
MNDVGEPYAGERHAPFDWGVPAKRSLTSITGKVKALCRSDTYLTLGVVLHQLNQVLRGWATYLRPGVSFALFQYLRASLGSISSLGCAANTETGSTGGTSAAATATADGGPSTAKLRCSIRPTRALPATGIGEQPFPRHGAQHEQTLDPDPSGPVESRMW